MNKSNLESFYAIADIAATQWYQRKCRYGSYKGPAWSESAKRRLTDSKAMTFRKPNFKHQRGYIAFLHAIANSESGVKRRALCELFNLKSVSLTTDNLQYAGLINLDTKYTHKFTITPFGRAYLALAERARPELEILAQAEELKKLM